MFSINLEFLKFILHLTFTIKMNKSEALKFLDSYSSVLSATQAFIDLYDFPDTDFSSVRPKFSSLRADGNSFNECNNQGCQSNRCKIWQSISITNPIDNMI